MKLIVGLGNPGKEYELTRHNAGFWVLDELQKMLHLSDWESFLKADSRIIRHPDFILAQPQTFMNDSGRAVIKLLNYFKINIPDIWIIHDDVDLDLGRIKIQPSGSIKNTHNGVASVISFLGSPRFPRFRLGIAGEKYKTHRIPAEEYVLKRFSVQEEIVAREMAKEGAELIVEALNRGIDKTQSKTINSNHGKE